LTDSDEIAFTLQARTITKRRAQNPIKRSPAQLL